MSNVVNVDDSNFETEVLSSDVPVLVDFSATWCGPCQRQIIVVDKFATQHLGSVKVCTVDIDDAPLTASKYGIRSVPTLLLFVDGQKVASKVGLTALRELDELLLGATK
jgi:thioredoxin 1